MAARRKRPATGCERILRALRLEGSRGVDRTMFIGPATYDGLDPVLNFAARIEELREHHQIIVIGRRHRCAVYRLIGERRTPPARPAADEALGQADEGALFGRAVGTAPPKSPYAEDEL